MLIAPETLDDIAAIRALITAAFPTDAEARLVDALRADSALALSLVARIEGALVGHAAFSPMGAPFPALGLAPLAVAEPHRRQGVGAGLVVEGLARAGAAGALGVFVVGEAAYYGRFGFSAADAAGFASPYAGPHFLLRILGPGLPARSGAVEYARAFADLG